MFISLKLADIMCKYPSDISLGNRQFFTINEELTELKYYLLLEINFSNSPMNL